MDEDPKKKKHGKRRLIGIGCSLISFIILTYIAVALISGRQSELFSFFGLFSGQGAVEMADEFHFDVGRSREFADMGDGIAAAGTLGVQVLDIAGSETLRDSFRMTYPAISAVDGSAIAFDIGGTSVRVFDKTEIVASFEASGTIISASINRNGWFSVCAQGSGITTGIITVYNDKGREVFRVFLATGYVVSAAVSPDNKSLAILNITGSGSRITFYNLNSEDVDREFNLPDEVIVDIRYMANGDVLVISTKSLFIAQKNNESKELYNFEGRRLGSFLLDGRFIALYLLDYGVGYNGRLLTLDGSGNLLGEIETDKEIISMSSGEDYLTVLRNDRMVFYSTELNELPVAGEASETVGTAKVLALGKGAALAAGDHSAVVVKSAADN